MKERQYLKKSILLRGESDGSFFKRTFTIVKPISKGASSVCYEAYHRSSGKGVLKEFYPEDAYFLERNSEGQLILSEGFAYERRLFAKAEKEYIEPFELLNDIRQKSEDQELSTFIPVFEIYYGCDRDGNVNGSVYIWTPEPKVETFDKVCNDIHKNLEKNYKLVHVLYAIKSLAECIRILHSEGIIHRDIKPANFGFKKRGNKILVQNLSLFDINTICSVYRRTNDLIETKGYLEPEGRSENVTNQTDIYAIGSTLFNAIVITDETKENGYLYQQDYYDRLPEMVHDSALIRATDANSNPRLVSILARILQRCLCDRARRYENCEQLLDDLDKALFYALPTEIAQKYRSGEKWVLMDAEKSLDANRERNASQAIRYHLYDHPLYRYAESEEENINVLVIGFGNYGQKFLDACLQAGQIYKKYLNITVLSDEISDKDSYLKFRPALDKFFNIDGSLDEQVRQGKLSSQDLYGDVAFETIELKRENQHANAEILKKTLSNLKDTGMRPHYIFIALGEDALNFSAARACRTAAKYLFWRCCVSYVCENKPVRGNGPDEELIPLHINADIKNTPVHAEIERMAFNTHLIWEKDLNIDFRGVKKNFSEVYNHDASEGNVLSIKYKLNSVGIDLEQSGFVKAACEFRELITDPDNSKLRDALIWIEHRRWVTEKLCLGWTRRSVNQCKDGITKDEQTKQHICMVMSRPDQMLATDFCRDGRFDKWDTATKEELGRLDNLDRMSVELHQMFMKEAKKAKNRELLSGSVISEIRALSGMKRETSVAFQEWYIAIKDIWNGDMEKVRRYSVLKDTLMEAVESLPGESRKSITELIQVFDRRFRPVLESMRYRDWKQDDTALVDQIPFILTFTENIHMVIPYATGSTTDLFGNVASPTVANPKKITFIYHFKYQQELEDFLKSLPGVVSYLKKKNVRSELEILLAQEGAESINIDRNYMIEMLSDIHTDNIKWIREPSKKDIASALKTSIDQRKNGNTALVVEKNKTAISSYLDGAGWYNFFPNYTFDMEKIIFSSVNNCDMFKYIPHKPYITVADMAALTKSSGFSSNHPEFYEDYIELWKRYREDTATWKSLCDFLKKYVESHDLIASFKKISNVAARDIIKKSYRYVIPSSCKASVEKILNVLKKESLVGGESGVTARTSDSCEVIVADKCDCKSSYEDLFACVQKLTDPDAVSVYYDSKKRCVYVELDDLDVDGAEFSKYDVSPNKVKKMKPLAEFCVDKGYMIRLKYDSEKVSFTFATRQIKELLTKAGRMLEIYIFHKVKEMGNFDDIVCGYYWNWADERLKNEFDCILTKGFRTFFLECKARSGKIESEFYFKLSALAQKFGVNTRAVLIADTEDKPYYDSAKFNEIQKVRGEGFDIITITDKKEIDDIGDTLLSIAEGTYSI